MGGCFPRRRVQVSSAKFTRGFNGFSREPHVPGFQGLHPSDPAGLCFQHIVQAEKWFLSLNSHPGGISGAHRPSGVCEEERAQQSSSKSLGLGQSWHGLALLPWLQGHPAQPIPAGHLSWRTPSLRIRGFLPFCPSHKEFWTFWKGFGGEPWLFPGCWCEIRVVAEEKRCCHVFQGWIPIQQRCLSHSWPQGALGVQYSGCDTRK